MPSAWNTFVKEFYYKQKKTNPSYEFKNALKDAAGPWKKMKGSSGSSEVPMMMKKSRKSRKSRKGKSSKKSHSSGRKSRKHH